MEFRRIFFWYIRWLEQDGGAEITMKLDEEYPQAKINNYGSLPLLLEKRCGHNFTPEVPLIFIISKVRYAAAAPSTPNKGAAILRAKTKIYNEI